MYLHQRGVKGFVTVNVLIFDKELAAVEEHIRHIAACGVDAVIVQASIFLSCWFPTNSVSGGACTPEKDGVDSSCLHPH